MYKLELENVYTMTIKNVMGGWKMQLQVQVFIDQEKSGVWFRTKMGLINI